METNHHSSRCSPCANKVRNGATPRTREVTILTSSWVSGFVSQLKFSLGTFVSLEDHVWEPPISGFFPSSIPNSQYEPASPPGETAEYASIEGSTLIRPPCS